MSKPSFTIGVNLKVHFDGMW